MQIRGTLSPRLEAVISLVRQGVVTADIGCDHAFVSIELIRRKISEFAYLCDIRKGPLSSADANVNDYCLKNFEEKEKRFKLVLTDGLHGLENASPEPDDIIIAGMGGELIARIMSESRYSKKAGVRFVLQPMTSQYELRRYLAQNGLEILQERYTREDSKIYQMILCTYTGDTYELSDAEAEVGSPEKTAISEHALYSELINKKIEKLKKIAALKAASGNCTDDEMHMIKELSNLKF